MRHASRAKPPSRRIEHRPRRRHLGAGDDSVAVRWRAQRGAAARQAPRSSSSGRVAQEAAGHDRARDRLAPAAGQRQRIVASSAAARLACGPSERVELARQLAQHLQRLGHRGSCPEVSAGCRPGRATARTGEPAPGSDWPPRSAPTRCSRKRRCRPETSPALAGRFAQVAARRRHHAVEQRLAGVGADIGRRQVQRNHVLVEQRVRACAAGGELARERATDRPRGVRAASPHRVVAAPLGRGAMRTQPRSRPCAHPAFAAGRRAGPAQHHAGRRCARDRCAARPARRTRPRSLPGGTGAGSAGTA